MAQRPLSPSLMMELTGKQMLRVCVCLCIGSKTEKKRGRDRKRERERKCRQMSAFTLWEAQGCLPRTERQESEREEKRKEDGERQRG